MDMMAGRISRSANRQEGQGGALLRIVVTFAHCSRVDSNSQGRLPMGKAAVSHYGCINNKKEFECAPIGFLRDLLSLYLLPVYFW